VQELAFTLADGPVLKIYVRLRWPPCLYLELVFCLGLSFFFDIHTTSSEEIAKLRAARRMWRAS